MVVSIYRLLGYEPNTLPLRQSDKGGGASILRQPAFTSLKNFQQSYQLHN